MNTAAEHPWVAESPYALATLRGHWPWFVLLGVALIALGSVALASPWVAILATTVAIGTLLIAGGVAEAAGALGGSRWSGSFVHLLSGALSMLVGLMVLATPADAALFLALSLACLLLMGGLFKVVAALNNRFAAWGWPLLNGVIDLALGALLLLSLLGRPEMALWVIGLFVGVNLAFRGLNWIGLGLVLRALPPPRPDRS